METIENKETFKPKKCIICDQLYDVIYQKGNYIIYRHSDRGHEHEFSCPVSYSGVVRE